MHICKGGIRIEKLEEIKQDKSRKVSLMKISITLLDHQYGQFTLKIANLTWIRF